MNANPIQKAMAQAGGQSKLAARLGITPQAVRKWERAWDSGNHQAVPAHRAVQIESAVGMSRHELRPDLWPAPQEAA
jgi:DNA-binding transcriptional regulator YdaS (Cro superfamily)